MRGNFEGTDMSYIPHGIDAPGIRNRECGETLSTSEVRTVSLAYEV